MYDLINILLFIYFFLLFFFIFNSYWKIFIIVENCLALKRILIDYNVSGMQRFVPEKAADFLFCFLS